MLITWVEPKANKPARPLIAGSTQVMNRPKAQPLELQDDPWANWIKTHGSTAQKSPPNTSSSNVARSCEGPIEQRFQKQDEQIAVLRESMRELHSRVEDSAQSNETFKQNVTTQLDDIKKDVKTQVANMSSQFEQSLDKAMRKQDTQLERSFAELKALILNKPVPAKKAKIQPPPGDANEDACNDTSWRCALHDSRDQPISMPHVYPYTPLWCAGYVKSKDPTLCSHVGMPICKLQAFPILTASAGVDQQLPVYHVHFQIVSMHFHNFLSGNRIGEASNPGPKVRIAVINPTALNGKTDDIINLNSQIILASETDYAQKLIMRDFEKKSFKCSFSNPVPDKKLTQDGRPSLRGDAIGTAVISNTPFRQ